MSKPQSFAAQKRLIHLSREQEERMAAQAAGKVQAFVGEAAKVQGMRCEVAIALATAQAQFAGVASVDLEECKAKAEALVAADAKQKWTDLKALFAELGVGGPQPHLEWAAKQAGVTLFDVPAEEEATLVQPASVGDLAKVIQ